MKNFYFFIAGLFIFTACLDEPDCVREAYDKVSFRFKNVANGNNRNVLFDSVSVMTDTLFYDSVRTNLTILPLNPFTGETTLIFYSTFGPDTITLEYKRLTRLISTDCGLETFFLDLEVKEHTFDSLRVIKKDVLPSETPNFEIFY